MLSLKEQEKHALEGILRGIHKHGEACRSHGIFCYKMRQWLNEHNIRQNISFSDNDVNMHKTTVLLIQLFSSNFAFAEKLDWLALRLRTPSKSYQ